MKVVFLGTPQFAASTLEALVRAGHDVIAVLTQPDRPKGRGQQMAFSPVKETALRLGLQVFQPDRVRRPETVELLKGFEARAMVVVGYGQIIPQTVIDAAPLGILNVHASLLPKYRGAAPIQWAVANGEVVTGVTTMRIDAGLDTGDMLLHVEVPIGPDETAVELGARLAPLGAQLLIDSLAGLELGTIVPRKQDAASTTYAPILKKEDGLIDWNRSAAVIHNRARGFQPWPGAYTSFRGQSLHLRKTRVAGQEVDAAPGTLIPGKRSLVAACGQGTALELLELQIEGRQRMPAEAFLNGQRVSHNEVLGERTT